jgi:hypothetical protein
MIVSTFRVTQKLATWKIFLNNAYISITFPGLNNATNFLRPYDTARLHSFQGLKRVDSSTVKRIIKEIRDVKDVLDSNLKKQ